MGTGIVSVALDLGHEFVLSLALLAIALVAFAVLATEIVHDFACDRRRLRIEIRSPDSFTSVAATAVIATRLTLAGRNTAAEFLLALAFTAWLALLAPVARYWTTPTTGVSFLPVVATESLAVVLAILAGRQHAEVLAAIALVPFLAGLTLYPLVAIRFDFRQLLIGRGDHWIAGGALAISALAAANLATTAHTLNIRSHPENALKHAAVVLWVAAVLWLPGLVTAEVLQPRMRHDIRRWSSVFPIGMYCTCSIAFGRLIDSGTVTNLARISTWIALAVWLTTAVAEGRSLLSGST